MWVLGVCGECVAPSNVQADKEFVWSLWKQLQIESPDIASAVDMVITRYSKQSISASVVRLQ